MRIRFFRLSKPARFNYKPRYYNPEAEELAQRVERAKGDSIYTKNEKGEIQRSTIRFRRTYAQEAKTSNTRLFVIFVVLLAIAFWLLRDAWALIINTFL